MLITLTLSAQQLGKLHETLEAPSNFWQYTWNEGKSGERRAFVLVESSQGTGAQCSGNTENGTEVISAVGVYEVTLEISETVWSGGKEYPSPIGQLLEVLKAIGIFDFSGIEKYVSPAKQ